MGEERFRRLDSRPACERLSRQQKTTEHISRRLETHRLREKMRRQQETAEQTSSRQEKRRDHARTCSVCGDCGR